MGSLVRAVERLSLIGQGADKNLPVIKIGDTSRRKKSTIDRGQTERLLWSDESVRAKLLVS